MAIQINGTTVIDNSRNLTNISNATSSAATANTYVIRDANGMICVAGLAGFLEWTSVGGFAEGGYVICKASSIGWIVAPSSSQVTRNWGGINDASTRAQQVSGCPGWFVPVCGQLQNPGSSCRAYWDSYSNTAYWSSTSATSRYSDAICLNTNQRLQFNKSCNLIVRAFRCVSY